MPVCVCDLCQHSLKPRVSSFYQKAAKKYNFEDLALHTNEPQICLVHRLRGALGSPVHLLCLTAAAKGAYKPVQ